MDFKPSAFQVRRQDTDVHLAPWLPGQGVRTAKPFTSNNHIPPEIDALGRPVTLPSLRLRGPLGVMPYGATAAQRLEIAEAMLESYNWFAPDSMPHHNRGFYPSNYPAMHPRDAPLRDPAYCSVWDTDPYLSVMGDTGYTPYTPAPLEIDEWTPTGHALDPNGKFGVARAPDSALYAEDYMRLLEEGRIATPETIYPPTTAEIGPQK